MAAAIMDREEVVASEGASTSRPHSIDSANRKGFTNRILLMVASPLLDQSGQGIEVFDPISSRSELEMLAKAVERVRLAFELGVHFVIPGRTVARDMFKERPLFIHVAAHGLIGGDKVLLAAESVTGERQFLDARGLSSLLRPFGTPPCALAVLNVCHSEKLADRLVQIGVPHVVAVESGERSLARAGNVFAEHFYYALLTGMPVNEAFEMARQAVYEDFELNRLRRSQDEYLKIRLFPDDVPHTETLAAEDSPGEPSFPPWQNTNLEECSRYPVIGRQLDIWKLNTKIQAADRHLFLLTGMGGMGKTCLSEAMGRWQHERSWWTKGVWKVDARDINHATDLRGLLAARVGLPCSVAETDGSLAEAMRQWHVLLILDDLDRLSRNDPLGLQGLLAALLGSCPRLRIVVSLRHLQEFPEPALCAIHDVRPLHSDHVLECFLKYHEQPLWTECESTYQTELKDLVRFLDGHPLAIKLAATHMRKERIGLHNLWRRLVDRPLETLRYRGAREDRDNSLRVSLEVSLDAMPPQDRDFYPLLAYFPSGLAEGVAEGAFGTWAIRRLEEIHSYSMVEIEFDRYMDFVERRFRLPEPARHFARWHLEQLELLEKFGQQVVRFFAQFVNNHASVLQNSAVTKQNAAAMLEELRKSKSRTSEDIENLQRELDDAAAAYARTRNVFWSEYANLPLWLSWALDHPSRQVLLDGCHILSGLTFFWGRESKEGPVYADKFFTKAKDAAASDPEARGVVDEARGDFQLLRGQKGDSQEDFKLALESYGEVGLSLPIARIHEKLAGLTDEAQSIDHLRRARKIYESLNESEGLAVARCSEELSVRQLRLADKATAWTDLGRATQEYANTSDVLRAIRRYARQATESKITTEAVRAFVSAITVASDRAHFGGMVGDVRHLCKLLRRRTKPPRSVVAALQHAQAAAENSNRDDIARLIRVELARL